MLNSEKTILAMNDVDDNYLESAGEMLGYKAEDVTSQPNKKRLITFALAAVLILGLSAAAYAIYRAAMYMRIPEEGTTEYHVLYNADPSAPPEMLHVNFDRTKIALRFDVPADGYFPVMRANDLPGAEENWEKTSFYSMLYVAQRFGLPWEMKQRRPDEAEIDPKQEPDELLKDKDEVRTQEEMESLDERKAAMEALRKLHKEKGLASPEQLRDARRGIGPDAKEITDKFDAEQQKAAEEAEKERQQAPVL